ncbi:MAG: helix-turn-helix transcriptional regulator [Rhizobacter sp.]|nr:helix-turn-helix transcriptional regulator [Bacteriovorax sp.]
MRSFKNIAILIRYKRITSKLGLSQVDLSVLLGYKNGQFISNVERGMCNIPLKTMKHICEILEINQEEIKIAILKDYSDTLTNYFGKPLTSILNKSKPLNGNEIVK